MEIDILDTLDDLGYNGIVSEEILSKMVTGNDGGPHNIEYTKLVSWLASELRVLASLEENVNAISSYEDHLSFLMELSSLLKELACPHMALTQGALSQRLSSKESRLLLLDFLVTELQAAKMIAIDKPNLTVHMQTRESESAGDLKGLMKALGFSKPPNNITSEQLFTKVSQKLLEVKDKANASLVGKPLFTGHLSDIQWLHLGELQKEMQNEYRKRRQMSIKRLDVTIQSFMWSDHASVSEDEMAKIFRELREDMQEQPKVTMADLVAAREDLAVLEKTSNAYVRRNTNSKLNKVIIGDVPDRGGRTGEHEPPPPEMPAWTHRQPGDERRGGGGRGRGGFVKGNQGGSQRGGYERHGGDYDRFGGQQEAVHRDGMKQRGRGRRGAYY